VGGVIFIRDRYKNRGRLTVAVAMNFWDRLSSGSVVANYIIDAELGSGGTGVVYRAHDTQRGFSVALKILPTNLSRDESYVKRFVREAESSSQLDHPNVVRTYGYGNHDGAYAYWIAPRYGFVRLGFANADPVNLIRTDLNPALSY
jgi:serine/threonine protein kinase